MKIVVIDGQGGGIGKALVAGIKAEEKNAEIVAVGTNSVATLAMQKAGADKAATGENAVVVACRNADIIAGPVGIVVADALIGEVTAKMAAAVGSSSAKKILIPVNMCDTFVVGVNDTAVSSLVSIAVLRIMNEIR
ncbi:MAG: DUF3842 family protein [Clostridia bacterium]|nr:DUF3842 family protein [Clostridiales bacterium]MBQ3232001.1 DUF3842 family protein [Clostridia bacterium]